MTEAEIVDGWKQANIARVLSEMERYGLTIADLTEADRIEPKATEPLPCTHQAFKTHSTTTLTRAHFCGE